MTSQIQVVTFRNNLNSVTMNNNQVFFLIILALFGIPVILSYIFGIKRIKNIDLLWGGMPKKIQKILTISMLISALSFFVFSSYIFVLSYKHYNLINIYFLYAVLLGSAALWLPLMIEVIELRKKIYWILTRISLALVGLCSIVLLSMMIFSTYYGLFFTFAITGLSLFSIHTVVLDAIVWPYFFTKKKEVGNVKKK